MSVERVQARFRELKDKISGFHSILGEAGEALEIAESEKRQLADQVSFFMKTGRAFLRDPDPSDPWSRKTVTTLEELMDLWEQGWR